MECTICCELLSNPAEDRYVNCLRFSKNLMRPRTDFCKSFSLTDLSHIPCGHQFHTRCLQNWLLTSVVPTCPNCRATTCLHKIKQISQFPKKNSPKTQSDTVQAQVGLRLNRRDKNSPFSYHRIDTQGSPLLDIIFASLRAHAQSDN